MNDWTDSVPWVENENLPKAICERASFTKLLDYFHIEYTQSWTGSFSHKLKCPLSTHANGNERTASCYVSDTTNKFFCFGCSTGGNIIDFVKLYQGKPYGETISWLVKFAGLDTANISDEVDVKEKRKPEETIKYWVFLAGRDMRKFLEERKNSKEYESLCQKAEKVFARLDDFCDNFKDESYEAVKKYYEKLKENLEK